MQCVTVVYANKPGAKFDFDYYLAKHIPMVEGFFGTTIEVTKGVSSPLGGELSFVCVARIPINSPEHFQTVLAEFGPRILSDITNYTNIAPKLQIDEVVKSR